MDCAVSMPTILGKYEIRRDVGAVAMGTVYEAWDPFIKRRVAIKTVQLPRAADSETRQAIARFRREAGAAGGLAHPNIVTVYDYIETGGLACIVMEFVDSDSLKIQLDRKEPFSVRAIVRIMDGLLSGLQLSHDHGVVHRDIEPGNVMLTRNGQAKLADFGIARIENSSLTEIGTTLGTPAYMSPEQFMGQQIDARTDMHSARVLLFHLLTGVRPFQGHAIAIMY